MSSSQKFKSNYRSKRTDQRIKTMFGLKVKLVAEENPRTKCMICL